VHVRARIHPLLLLLQVSLGGLWVMPAIIGITLKFWRFLAVWVVYSLITGYLMSLCSHKKMARSTPRMVSQFGVQRGFCMQSGFCAKGSAWGQLARTCVCLCVRAGDNERAHVECVRVCASAGCDVVGVVRARAGVCDVGTVRHALGRALWRAHVPARAEGCWRARRRSMPVSIACAWPPVLTLLPRLRCAVLCCPVRLLLVDHPVFRCMPGS
jgi:hypothetical protein